MSLTKTIMYVVLLTTLRLPPDTETAHFDLFTHTILYLHWYQQNILIPYFELRYQFIK